MRSRESVDKYLETPGPSLEETERSRVSQSWRRSPLRWRGCVGPDEWLICRTGEALGYGRLEDARDLDEGCFSGVPGHMPDYNSLKE